MGPRGAELRSAGCVPEPSYSRPPRWWRTRWVLVGVLSAVLRGGWRSMVPGVPKGSGVDAGQNVSGGEGGARLSDRCRRMSRYRQPATRPVGPGRQGGSRSGQGPGSQVRRVRFPVSGRGGGRGRRMGSRAWGLGHKVGRSGGPAARCRAVEIVIRAVRFGSGTGRDRSCQRPRVQVRLVG